MYDSNIFDRFNDLNILILGDVMIDRYLTGKVSRISPEAPVPVVHLASREDRLGGAANVALNIKAMGAKPYLCSYIGKDENGAKFLELLPVHGLSSEGLLQSESRMTTVKTRVIASSQHLLRVDQENIQDLNDRETTAFIERVKYLLDTKEIHAILFQDYNKGVLTSTIIEHIIDEAKKRKIPTAVDPKNKNFWAYKQVNLFKPNLKEIRDQIPSLSINAVLEDLNRASLEINKQLDNTYTLITLSEKGMFLAGAKDGVILPTHTRQIADVCGAGDTVISLATLGLALNLEMELVAQLANLAGGQVCEKVGVVPVNKEQLAKEFTQIKTL